MPKKFTQVIPWGMFQPDYGHFSRQNQDPYLIKCRQVIPYATGYMPEWASADFASFQSLAGRSVPIVGGMSAASAGRDFLVFLGSKFPGDNSRPTGNGTLYFIASNEQVPWPVYDVGSEEGYLPDPDTGWRFTQFGNFVLACGGYGDVTTDTPLQYIDIATLPVPGDVPPYATFESAMDLFPMMEDPDDPEGPEIPDPFNVADYIFAPKFVASIGERVMIANMKLLADRNGPPVAATGYIDFNEGGGWAIGNTFEINGVGVVLFNGASDATTDPIRASYSPTINTLLDNLVTVLNSNAAANNHPAIAVATYSKNHPPEGQLFITHDTKGEAGNLFTLAVTVGPEVVSGATLTGGEDQAVVDVDFPYRVAWSGTDNIRVWSDPFQNLADRSSFQDLLDEHGAITGISGGTDFGIIFKHRNMYRMDFGGPFDFTFKPIPRGFGTRWSHSIIRIGQDVYYWGPSGPAVYHGINNTVEELAIGKLTRSLLDQLGWVGSDEEIVFSPLAPEYRLSVGHDSANGIIVWSLPTVDGTNFVSNYMLVYSYVVGQFSVVKRSDFLRYKPNGSEEKHRRSMQYLFDSPSIDDPFCSMRDILLVEETVQDQSAPYFVDTTVTGYTGLTDAVAPEWPVLANEEEIGFKSGFFELAPDGRQCRITGLRPIYNAAAHQRDEVPVLKMRVNGFETPIGGDPNLSVEVRSDVDIDRRGYIRVPGCPWACFWQIELETESDHRVNAPQYLAELEGYEVEYEIGGTK